MIEIEQEATDETYSKVITRVVIRYEEIMSLCNKGNSYKKLSNELDRDTKASMKSQKQMKK